MGLVNNNATLFTTLMESKDTLNKYDHVFKAQVNMIKWHVGNPGYHGTAYLEHYDAITVRKGYDIKEKMDAVDATDINKMKSEALKTSASAYLGCLVLVMANERYTLVKTFLHEVFLEEQQQYLREILALKRFMANFIWLDAGKPKRRRGRRHVCVSM